MSFFDKLFKRKPVPEFNSEKLASIPVVAELYRQNPNIKMLRVIRERQFYDVVFAVGIEESGNYVEKEIVRMAPESLGNFARTLTNIHTLEELVSLDEASQIYYD